MSPRTESERASAKRKRETAAQAAARMESERTPANRRESTATPLAMFQSELVRKLCEDHPDLTGKEIGRVVSAFFDALSAQLRQEGRVELRGFGAFSAKERKARAPIQESHSPPAPGRRTEIKPKRGKLPADYIGGHGRDFLSGRDDTFLAYSESGNIFTLRVVETAAGGPLSTISSSGDPLVDAGIAAVLERVPEIVHARQEALSQETIDLLVDAYLRSAPTAAARREIEMDNARERARFVEEFPCYTSREVAELAGHEAANASATATRWKKARRIIGLPWKGSDLYPAFQFSEGRPRPEIGRVIVALPDGMSPWQIAFWLTSSNGWLGGATPLERLDQEDALLAAAEREGETLAG